MNIANDRDQSRVDVNEAALTMAIAVVVDRIRTLSKEDRDDLYQISKAFFAAETREEQEIATAAFREILEQTSGRTVPFLVEDEPIGMEGWLSFVSARIKKAREEAGMTQAQLEERTGLPQSHISRLENAVHSPSSATLSKIASATGKPPEYFDPSHVEEDLGLES